MATAKEVDALLPQTQCGDCGYPGCMPYAQAIAQGLAPIDQCPPGGVDTVKALAKLMQVDAAPYIEKAAQNQRLPAVAVIREVECIGCTKCIQACPVDAIVGSAKMMHSILQHECTGCGLCVEPCPVDCIEMVAVAAPCYDQAVARARYDAKQVRQLRQDMEAQQHYRNQRRLAASTVSEQPEREAKQAYILAALARVQAKKKHE